MKALYIETPLVTKARLRATELHSTSKAYSGMPYIVHPTLVAMIGYEFHYLLNGLHPDIKEAAMAGLWLHDTQEDCCQTYNDTKNEFGFHTAEAVYYVTDHKGKNRAERQRLTYKEMQGRITSVFIKVCDRIANMRWGFTASGSMGDMYVKEDKHFQSLRTDDVDVILADLWEAYQELVDHAKELIEAKAAWEKRKIDVQVTSYTEVLDNINYGYVFSYTTEGKAFLNNLGYPEGKLGFRVPLDEKFMEVRKLLRTSGLKFTDPYEL